MLISVKSAIGVGLLFASGSGLAWAAETPRGWIGDLSPIGASDWNYDRAAHLLERAGFGGTPQEIQALAALTPEQAVHRLVRYQDTKPAYIPPFIESGIFPSARWSPDRMANAFSRIVLLGNFDQATPAEKAELLNDDAVGVTPEMKRIAKTDKQAVVDALYYYKYVDLLESARLETWMLQRMLSTNRPLEEKLALFWHGHFATGNEKVRDYRKMMGQFAMFRENGNKNLRDLLVGIGKDPAMLIYLDNRQNLKGHPNENFAREILELFSLGVGNYSEKDIKEAARAFSGWSLDDDGMKFMNRPDRHDDGQKTFLGKTGNFQGEDLVDIILQQPACSRFMAAKLYRYFGRDDISNEFRDQLAATLVSDKYEIAPFLETIFLSKDFYSDATVAKQIKSPVQLIVSTYKKLGIVQAPTFPRFAATTAGLGQQIFYPPNVKGWDGGRTWINPATIFDRQNIVRHMMFPEELIENPTAYLDGSRRLSGEVIHSQFLSQMAEGNFTDFPDNGTGMMSNSMGGPMKGASGQETAKLSGQDFNLFRGVFNGVNFARRTVPPDSRKTPDFRLSEIVKQAGATDAAGVVDAMLHRFLRAPISADQRAKLVGFCRQQIGGSSLDYQRPTLEKDLREVLHLILSTPEYQVS